MTRPVLLLSMLLVVALLAGRSQLWAVPPEIMEQYRHPKTEHREIGGGEIDAIWALRESPDTGAYLKFFVVSEQHLETAQVEILKQWVRNGGRLLIAWDLSLLSRMFAIDIAGARLGDGRAQREPTGSAMRLREHPVSTDVHIATFQTISPSPSRYWYLLEKTPLPPGTERVVEDSQGRLVAGGFPYGRGFVCFASIGPSDTTLYDNERWLLNWHEWVAGFPVPGAAKTRIRGPSIYLSGQWNVALGIDIVVTASGETLDVMPVVVNGRTYLPVSVLASAMGVETEWDPATRTVAIER